VIALERLGGPLNYAVEAKVTYKQPGTAEIKVETTAKHHWTPEEHVVAFKVSNSRYIAPCITEYFS